jgi:hypothetical protein
MKWKVLIEDGCQHGLFALPENIQALAKLLQQFGPQLGHPRVDTLKEPRDQD